MSANRRSTQAIAGLLITGGLALAGHQYQRFFFDPLPPQIEPGKSVWQQAYPASGWGRVRNVFHAEASHFTFCILNFAFCAAHPRAAQQSAPHSLPTMPTPH